MTRDKVVNHILDKLAAEYSKKLGVEITADTIHTIVDYQFKIVRNCIRGGQPIVLDKFGSFHLVDERGGGRVASFVKSKGGYKTALKRYQVKGEVQTDEVIYNPVYFPDLVEVPLKDQREKFYGKPRPKEVPFFKKTLTNKRRSEWNGQGENDGTDD